jgi:hypothetical protein
MADMRLTVRVDFGSDRVLGPGKIRLLEAIKRVVQSHKRGAYWTCRIAAHGSLSIK